jgi:iron complex transport system ATP-binding protein
VLHHLDDARRVADRVVLMHAGRIVAEGSPDAVLTEAHLGEAFRVAPVPGGALGFRLLERRS